MTYWPKWLKFTFIVSGFVFLFGGLIVRSLLAPNPLWTGDTLSSDDATNIATIITAVAGLVTATSGLYGQILAGRKMKLDYELAKQQLATQAAPEKPRR